ncbi:hypothetical protein V6N11_067770 [Hibiscus sabdariffa]|uniref:Uncharacterized protein n=1 Tax=Hibiscus sabdariffa TaxID=183260 RepID=A0ABR2SSH3_9ROSI
MTLTKGGTKRTQRFWESQISTRKGNGKPLKALSQLLHPNNKVGNGVKKPIEKKSGGDEKRVALALHDGFLVSEMLGRSARIGFAAGPGLVFPVDIHKKEETKGDDRHEGFEEAARDGDQALAETVEAGECEEEYHDGFCTGGVAKHYPF